MAEDRSPVLSVEEAAKAFGITPEELLFSRAKGREPGTLGFKETWDGPLVFRRTDTLKTEKAKENVEAKAQERSDLTCPDCGETFGSKGALGSHRRTHGTVDMEIENQDDNGDE